MKRFLLPVFISALAASASLHADAPKPPAQPTTGPGGSDYVFTEVESHSTGDGASDAIVYWPKGAPAAKTPVVVFLHGWGALKPDHYLAWIHHLTRRGNIVIFPRYQDSLRTKAANFEGNAIAGVQASVKWLSQQSKLPQPDEARWALVGHSMGGTLTANLAVELPKAGLPTPKALLSAEPGASLGDSAPQAPLADFSKIAASTLLIIVTGESDRLVGDKIGRKIYDESTAIPAANKNWVQLSDDDHGAPALKADHRAPAAPLPGYQPEKPEIKGGPIRKKIAERRLKKFEEEHGLSLGDREPPVLDALDFYGTWKLFDALCSAAFEGKNRDIALGGSEAQLSLGTWSDGVAVKPMKLLGPVAK